MKNWPNKDSCFVFAPLNFFITNGSWMSLGLVAFSRYVMNLIFVKHKWFFLRYLSITNPKLWKALSVKHRNLMMVGGIWLYALLIVFIPILGNFRHFGYNDRQRKCDYIEVDENLGKLFNSIQFGLPFILMVVSYFKIWRKSQKSTSSVKPYL